MGADRVTAGECHLCGRPISKATVESEADLEFCSHGCKQVHLQLGSGEPEDERPKATTPAGEIAEDREGFNAGETDTDHRSRTFLRVDGMHTITCEAFLESIAESLDGVMGAEASYVTETIRIEYDPDQTPVAELCDALSTVGYSATPREGATETTGPTDQSQQSGRPRERGLDDLLGFRYVAGVVFGSFMLLPYIVLLYPAQLASFLDAAGFLPTGSGFSGSGSLMALRLFLVMTGVVLFFTGLPLLRGAYVSLKMRRPNTDLLVTITVVSAYVYSTIAFLLGRIDVFYDMTIVIVAGVVAAIFYESVAKQRAVDLLTDLTISQVADARLYQPDDTTTTVSVAELDPGDRVLVRQGERIPVDGVLAEGECTVNEAIVTGESLPVPKQEGDDIIGGAVVTDGAAVIRVGERATSSIDRLTTAVWTIQSADHGIQRRADELASIIVPVVVGFSVLAGLTLLVVGSSLSTVLLTVLTVLIVGCPWALGLSIPVSVATSIEEGMDRGIVVFDETVFERLLDIDTVVFDKTGTLTTGAMDVIETDVPTDLLAAAATLERRAAHPAATAIVTAFDRGSDESNRTRADGGLIDNANDSDDARIADFESYSNGVRGTVDGAELLVGNLDLFADHGWSVSDRIAARAVDARGIGRLPVVIGRDGTAEGLVVVGDEPRDGWDDAFNRLGERDVEIVVLTGDDEEATDYFGRHPDVDHVFAAVPPEGKTATIRRLQTTKRVSMVGDGTNDAPALAQSDLGISLGSGTALASDAADVTIVDDDVGSVETVFDLAQTARRRLKQNTGLALLYNGITIPLAAIGLLNPLFAMVAVLTSSGLIALNAVRKFDLD